MYTCYMPKNWAGLLVKMCCVGSQAWTQEATVAALGASVHHAMDDAPPELPKYNAWARRHGSGRHRGRPGQRAAEPAERGRRLCVGPGLAQSQRAPVRQARLSATILHNRWAAE